VEKNTVLVYFVRKSLLPIRELGGSNEHWFWVVFDDLKEVCDNLNEV
jgi:hypothetical protein